MPVTASVAAIALAAVCAGSAPTWDDVAPVLAGRCVMCHSGPSAPLGLALDTLDGVMRGSANGPVARPGDPTASELVRRIKGTRLPRMPMTGPPFLSDQETALLECWVAAGLPAGTRATTPPPATPDTARELARPAAGEPATYAHVAPIFARRCAKCHTEQGQRGPAPEGYRLTSYAATLDPRHRARVVPGVPEASELLRKVRGQSRPRMPLDGPPYLDDEEIGLVERWIADGARDAAGTPAPLPVGAAVRVRGTLGGAWTLDGLPLDARAARIDRQPGPGHYVEVRGRVKADGTVAADRIRRR